METGVNCLLKMGDITGKDILIFEDLHEKPTKNIHSDAYVAILCTTGKGYFEQDGKAYDIGENDLVICHPNVFVDNVMVNIDFRCQGMAMSPAFFESIFLVDGNFWDFGLSIFRNPVIHLQEEEAEDFKFNFHVLKKKLALTDIPHYDQMIKLLLQSMLYEFSYYLLPHLQLIDTQYNYSSGESIFKHFVLMLSHETPKRRNVNYYSERLCITSKYLSSICKKQCGKTASDLINDVTVKHIKNLLQSSDKTIKEIATEMGFDNLSFFGKFVRRELGMSPRAFRLQK